MEDVDATHIVISGNPSEGHYHYGPFDGHSDALDWCESTFAGTDWWIVQLYDPKTIDDPKGI